MKPSLCLNMIVKNEEARIERALHSALPYIKAIAVYDTGSTDNTVDLILAVAAVHGVKAYVEIGEFVDFSQARNAAFAMAQKQNGEYLPWCQFALLMDADMELVVTDPKAFDDIHADAGSYDMIQKGGALSYGNRRLLNLDWGKPPYVGVTHEYIDVPAAGMVTGAMFVDHADGSNRADKYTRDAALLENALLGDPLNGRYLYYLGNTYRDGNKAASAIDAYDRRIKLGGWEEETHSAMMHRAECRRTFGDDAGFVTGMLEAYNFRPQRAEPLFELAKFYREKGDNRSALLFTKPGMEIKRPNDLLFINDYVYDHGLRYEHSIVGYYDPEERPRAAEITDDLALDPSCPAGVRYSARCNMQWHTIPLADLCPSFEAKQIKFTPPPGYTPMNPSIEEFGGVVSCNIRCVNYRMDSEGRYLINGTDGTANNSNPIDTRNFVVKLDHDMVAHAPREIVWRRPEPAFPLVTGLEDVRLWRRDGALWFNACVRELLPHGTPQQVAGTFEHMIGPDELAVTDWRAISDGSVCEKNWMHLQGDLFVHRIGQMVVHMDGSKKIIKSPRWGGDLSGSSQCIPLYNGFLCVVHEAFDGGNGRRIYWHRFAWMNEDGELQRVSKPFYFFDRQIEFCAGLCRTPAGGELMLSFGVRDAEAWVATVSIEDVQSALADYR